MYKSYIIMKFYLRIQLIITIVINHIFGRYINNLLTSTDLFSIVILYHNPGRKTQDPSDVRITGFAFPRTQLDRSSFVGGEGQDNEIYCKVTESFFN